MSKEERYTYHCDQYDYIEVIYDNEECEEIDSMKMAEKRLNRQQDKISDLEAKLAESEENNKLLEMQLQDMERSKLSWENQYFTLYNTLKNYREVTEKQLAEKEKENELMAKTLKLTKFVEKEVTQDKISFAVEQLEKAKGRIQHNIVFVYCDDYLDVIEEIDNQIKQLKTDKNV